MNWIKDRIVHYTIDQITGVIMDGIMDWITAWTMTQILYVIIY